MQYSAVQRYKYSQSSEQRENIKRSEYNCVVRRSAMQGRAGQGIVVLRGLRSWSYDLKNSSLELGEEIGW